MRATVHVGVRRAGRHRLPRGASSERSGPMPGGGRASGRGDGDTSSPNHAPHTHQTRGAGNAHSGTQIQD